MATKTPPVPVSSRSRVKGNGQPEPVPLVPEKEVMIHAPRFGSIALALVGITPLIIHNMSKKQALELLAVRFGKKKPARGEKDAEKEYAESRYISTKGWDGMHAGAFRSACVGAARMTDDIHMTDVARLIHIVADGDSAPMFIPELKITLSSKPLVRIIGESKMRTDMVRIDKGKPDIRFRAEYWPWSVILKIEFNANQISAEAMANLVSLAGLHEGVGEGRPSAPKNHTGEYGMWKVKGE